MILDKGHGLRYLEDWKDDKIEQGRGLGNQILDQYLVYKENQLNFVLALDNLRKTHWMLWYFLCLSVKYGLVWDICAMENTPNSSMRRLVEMKCGKRLKYMTNEELYKTHSWVDRHFNFLDHRIMYNYEELFEIFRESHSDGCFIDPFTALSRKYTHEGNYEFLHAAREFVNRHKTIYTSLHTRTEAGQREYPRGHDLEGYIKPPHKSHCEGGQSFANRCDDFLVLHRHPSHPHYRYKTELHIVKVKETETGGSPTISGEPVVFEFNSGLGFTIGGQDILRKIEQSKTPIEVKNYYEKENDELF